ncbi:MAG: hypothetical protein ABII80_03615 [bacterium]
MRKKNIEIPKWSIAFDSPYLGKREFVRSNGKSFWSFLKTHKIKFAMDDFPFLTNHKIPRVKQSLDFGEYINLSGKGEALAYLYKAFGKAWNYVGPVLDFELPHGFNDHTDRHTLWVTSTAVEILQRAGKSSVNQGGRYEAKSEVLSTLVGMTHDLGNLLDREQHSMYSAWLLTRLFYNQEADKKAWEAVLFTILFHEEPMLRDLRVNLADGMPLQWALIAADKMHVGRDRIGDRSYTSGIANRALEDDVHILLNTLVVRSAWIRASGAFVWHLDFSVEQLEEKVASFTKGKGRIWVPKEFHRQFSEGGKPYREIFAELFVSMYESRIRMAAMSIFLLFPELKKFQVYLTDAKNGNGSGRVGKGELLVCELVR